VNSLIYSLYGTDADLYVDSFGRMSDTPTTPQEASDGEGERRTTMPPRLRRRE
jgi:hypothetical protein